MADVSCNSGFMRDHMLSIGAKIREKMHWIDADKPIFLVMDNAGGHGTKDAIEAYVDGLKEEHNVVVVWQIPRSPETNLLDLGVWNSLQAWVDKEHCGTKQHVNVLAQTVDQAWNTYCTQEVFEKVYLRREKVLKLIIAGNGDKPWLRMHVVS